MFGGSKRLKVKCKLKYNVIKYFAQQGRYSQ